MMIGGEDSVLTLKDICDCMGELVYQQDSKFYKATSKPRKLRAILCRDIIDGMVQGDGGFQDTEAGYFFKKNLEAKSHSIKPKLRKIYDKLVMDDYRAIEDEEAHLRVLLSNCAYISSLNDSKIWHISGAGSVYEISDRYNAHLSGIDSLSPERQELSEELSERIKSALIHSIGLKIGRQCLPCDYTADDDKEENLPEVLKAIDGVKLLTAAIIIALNYQNNSTERRENDKTVDALTKRIHNFLVPDHALGEEGSKRPAPKAACHKPVTASLSCIFEREKDNPSDVFVLPNKFKVPHEPLEQLLNTAFLDSKIHVISGQRGMGKSELARCFSRICCGDESYCDTLKLSRDELKYNTVIWTTYSERGLKDTISRLNYSEEASEEVADNQQYSEKIRLLSETKKPCLLVIDNFDNEISFAKELASNSSEYTELLKCGCHILLTSKIDLRDCYAVRQTEIPPLPEDQLYSLFWELCKEEKTETNVEKATELIVKYLDRNTYLVILAAKLTETVSLDYMLKAFKELSVAQMDDPVSAEKDGKKQPSASLISQYKTMFNLSVLQGDLCKTRLLYNLSLLPIGGMPYREFFSLAFPPEEKEAMKQALSQLQDSFWVFSRNRYISIHPLIREMIISFEKRFDYSYIQHYIHSFNDRLRAEHCTEHTYFDLEYASSAYEACEKLGVINLDTTELVSNIAATYDLVKNPEATYYYSKQAMRLLQAVSISDSFDDNLTLAACYNMVGYAILHVKKEPKSKEIAERALLHTKSLVDKLLASDQSNGSLVDLQTKNEGNLAALYITKREYNEALKLHKAALKVRLKLVEDSPSPDTKLLLAAAYKGVATDYFYLSKQQEQSDRLSLLQMSLENHRLSVELYEEVLSVDSLEACIANNRLIGTGLTWLRTLVDEAVSNGAKEAVMHSSFADSQAAMYIDKTLSVARYLCSIEQPIASEISNCISNTERLANYLDSIECYDKDHLRKLQEIAKQAFEILSEEKLNIPSEEKAKLVASISTICDFVSAHIQEEAAYER